MALLCNGLHVAHWYSSGSIYEAQPVSILCWSSFCRVPGIQVRIKYHMMCTVLRTGSVVSAASVIFRITCSTSMSPVYGTLAIYHCMGKHHSLCGYYLVHSRNVVITKQLSVRIFTALVGE